MLKGNKILMTFPTGNVVATAYSTAPNTTVSDAW